MLGSRWKPPSKNWASAPDGSILGPVAGSCFGSSSIGTAQPLRVKAWRLDQAGRAAFGSCSAEAASCCACVSRSSCGCAGYVLHWSHSRTPHTARWACFWFGGRRGTTGPCHVGGGLGRMMVVTRMMTAGLGSRRNRHHPSRCMSKHLFTSGRNSSSIL